MPNGRARWRFAAGGVAGSRRQAASAEGVADRAGRVRQAARRTSVSSFRSMAAPPASRNRISRPPCSRPCSSATPATVKTWLTSGGASLVGRLSALSDANAMVEELYLSTLSRLPDEQERLEAIEYVIRNEQQARRRSRRWPGHCWRRRSSGLIISVSAASAFGCRQEVLANS